MMKVRNVSKYFGEGEATTKALNKVSLDLHKGEIVSIMGPSGCGKSTLLNVLSGIEKVSEGEIWMEDQAIHKLNDTKLSDIRLKKMGFVFQQYNLVPVLNAAENVALPLISKGLSEASAMIASREALNQVGLEGKEKNMISELSGGQAQRVAIARAIAGDPSILWADEPTGALDTDSSQRIIELLNQLNKSKGITIVVVTHDPTVAKSTDRTIFMENGQIIERSEGEELCSY